MIRLDTQHGKHKSIRGKVLAHVASLGSLECQSATKAEAEAALAKQASEVLADSGAPFVLFDWVDPACVWIAHRFGSCWGYSIIHRDSTRHTFGRDAVGTAGGSLGRLTRDEAIAAMKFHWYQNNVEPVVNGILALCTARRQVECSRCSGVGIVREAPYRCANPACPSHKAEEVSRG